MAALNSEVPAVTQKSFTAQQLDVDIRRLTDQGTIGIMKSRTIFTTGTAATYTPPAGCRFLLVELIGGGGGGGGTSTSAGAAAVGGGGGAGAVTETFFTTVAATYTYTVGAAGSAGSTSAGNGGNGGDTLFGTMIAKGGSGGLGQAFGTTVAFAAGGAGGLASGGVGDLKIDGEAGTYGNRSTGLIAVSGQGGSGAGDLGGGGGIHQAGAGVGANGGNYGAGGSGGSVLNNSAAVAGGTGAVGAILISELY